MARIESHFDLSGNYGNLVVYKVGSNLYARRRSSLTGKRYFKDPAFAHSREKAKAFGEASSIAKEIYAALPKAIKRKGLFGKIVGIIHRGLLAGKTREEWVREVYVEVGIVKKRTPCIDKVKPERALKLQLLSKWQVTKNGKLQPITTSLLPFIQPIQKAATRSFQPDG